MRMIWQNNGWNGFSDGTGSGSGGYFSGGDGGGGHGGGGGCGDGDGYSDVEYKSAEHTNELIGALHENDLAT